MNMKPCDVGDLVKTDDGREGRIVHLGFAGDPKEHTATITPAEGEDFKHPVRALAHVSQHFQHWTDPELIELWANTPQRKGHSRPVDYARKVLGGKVAE